MPDQDYYDIDYRPLTYWDTPAALLANIKGARPKELAREFPEKEDLEGLQAWMIRERLPEALVDLLGRIVPEFLGGEYLPDCNRKDVEIARVTLRSVLADAISVRAQRARDVIVYRIVDEYGTGFDLPFDETEEPLSLGQLITLMDLVWDEFNGLRGLTRRYRDLNYHAPGDAEALRDFVSVSSDYYTELSDWYEEEAEEWLRAKREEAAGAA